MQNAAELHKYFLAPPTCAFGSNLTFYIQNCIFSELDLPLPSSKLCENLRIWTEKEFTCVHPAHKQDQIKGKRLHP